MRKSMSGFTIVELLVVIVVIAILATVTIVAFNGVQNRANDAKMATAANQFEKALRVWTSTYGSNPKGGWGSTVAVSNGQCTDGSSGWLASGLYTCTVEDALVSAGQLPKGFVAAQPKNVQATSAGVLAASDGRYSMMMYGCGSQGSTAYALFWTLRNPSATDTANLNSVLTTCGLTAAGLDTTYGMRAAKILIL